MVLLVVVILALCVGIYKLVTDWYKEEKRREQAIKDGKDYYFDRYNRTCETKTRIPYTVRGNMCVGDKYTDTVKVGCNGGIVMHNYTQDIRTDNEIQREKNKQGALDNGDKYYIYEKKRMDWPNGMNFPMFEFQVNSAEYRNVLFPMNYIWSDVNLNNRFFAYRLPLVINAIVMVDIPTGKITGIVHEEKYTSDELEKIHDAIKELSRAHDTGLKSWKYVKSWDWVNDLNKEVDG